MKRCVLFGMLFLPSILLAQAPVADRLSPDGLPSSVLVAAGGLPQSFEHKDNSPVTDALKDAAPVGFQFLETPADQPWPGLVGVHVPPEAVFQIKRRVMSNVGKGTVTLRLAASPRRGARTVELSGRQTADYNELRRAAFERAAGSPYPPKDPPAPVVPKGTLVIHGGGPMSPDVVQWFVDAAGGAQGRFVVLPIAAPGPVREEAEKGFLRRHGAKDVTVVPHRARKDLEDPKVLEAFARATGVWFGGGRQWRFVDAYEGTKIEPLIHAVLARGGAVGGSGGMNGGRSVLRGTAGQAAWPVAGDRPDARVRRSSGR